MGEDVKQFYICLTSAKCLSLNLITSSGVDKVFGFVVCGFFIYLFIFLRLELFCVSDERQRLSHLYPRACQHSRGICNVF